MAKQNQLTTSTPYSRVDSLSEADPDDGTVTPMASPALADWDDNVIVVKSKAVASFMVVKLQKNAEKRERHGKVILCRCAFRRYKDDR